MSTNTLKRLGVEVLKRTRSTIQRFNDVTRRSEAKP
jgi:hypothetical protein